MPYAPKVPPIDTVGKTAYNEEKSGEDGVSV